MAEAVIVEAVRSPIGKRNGGLSGVHAADLSAQVLNGLSDKAGIDPEIVDDVIWGCVMQAGEQALDIARTSLLAAGWPETVPGVTVDRQCGSSQQSIHFAAAGVVAGHYDVVVAGGVESMSRTPMGASLASGGRPYPEAFMTRYDGQVPNQGLGAEMIAEQWGFDRLALDEFSLGHTKKPQQHRIPVPSTTRSWASKTKTAMLCSRTKGSAAVRRWRRWLRSRRRSRKTA